MVTKKTYFLWRNQQLRGVKEVLYKTQETIITQIINYQKKHDLHVVKTKTLTNNKWPHLDEDRKKH